MSAPRPCPSSCRSIKQPVAAEEYGPEMRDSRNGGTRSPGAQQLVDYPVVPTGTGASPTSGGRPKPITAVGSLDDLVNVLVGRVVDSLAERLAPLVTSRRASGLLKPRQAAEYAQVPESWLMDKARARVVRSYKVGHYVLFDREELLADLKGLNPKGGE